MSRQARGLRPYRFVIAAVVMLGAAGSFLPAADAVLDAKRKAAAQLLKDGKPNEAISLTREVLTADDTSYADHLLLAHAYEKLNQPAEAAKQYKRVLEMVPASATRADEKTARAEADKKMKLMDPMGAKLEAFTDDTLRKLDALEKEAITLRSMSALERIFRLRGHLWVAEGRHDRAYFEVRAGAEWQDTGFPMVAGQTYRVRAAGTWSINGAFSCTAAGTTDRPVIAPYNLRPGQLAGNVSAVIYVLGEDVTITPTASGNLTVISESDAGQADRKKNSGTLQLLIESR